MDIRIISDSEAEVLVDSLVLGELGLTVDDLKMKTSNFVTALKKIADKVRTELNEDATDMAVEVFHAKDDCILVRVKILDDDAVDSYKKQLGIKDFQTIMKELDQSHRNNPIKGIEKETSCLDDVCYVCKLKTLNQVIALCHRLNDLLHGVDETLHFSKVLKCDDSYFFVLSIDRDLRKQTKEMIACIIYDYLVKEMNVAEIGTFLFNDYLSEHGKAIVKIDAIQKLSKLY